MLEMVGIIAMFLMVMGAFFMITGAIGLIRFPDFYTRLHAIGKCDTLGEVLILLGCMIYSFFSGFELVAPKLAFIILFLLVANPTSTHAMMKAAFKTGVKPWRVGERRR
ncbi:MAG: monovalent cation/H(+) antiporter subunit G [Candidatus Methanospirareceae archaeon]